VHVDHARDKHIAVQVERAGRRRDAGLHVRDDGAVEHDRPVQHGVGQHEAGVGQDGGHAASWKGVGGITVAGPS